MEESSRREKEEKNILNIFLYKDYETCMYDQHEQWKTELPKQLALVAIFLTPVSPIRENLVLGDRRLLSIMLIFGASRIALGSDSAHCMPQIARGLI